MNCSKAMGVMILGCLLLGQAISWSIPKPVYGWASVIFQGRSAHRFIDARARERIAADPAFPAAKFPTPEAIAGFDWVGTDGRGPGPDNYRVTRWRDHYYNPVLNEGNVPALVGQHFTNLATALLAPSPDQTLTAMSAAWASHFLGEMMVPFHVVGCEEATIRTYRNDGRGNTNPIVLPATITGGNALCYRCDDNDIPTDHRVFIDRFYTTRENDNAADFFDAWYFNGDRPATQKSSSHFLWEWDAYDDHTEFIERQGALERDFVSTVSEANSSTAPGEQLGLEMDPNQPHWPAKLGVVNYFGLWRNPYPYLGPRISPEIPQSLSPPTASYHASWKNPAPTFKDPIGQAAKAAVEFTKETARFTRRHISRLVNMKVRCLNGSIDTSATLWRAAFSGMSPEIELKDHPEGTYIIAKIENKADKDVTGVEAKLTLKGGKIIRGEETQKVGAIKTGKKGEVKWLVKLDIGSGEDREATVETIGSYPIPDLQYAKKVKIIGDFPRYYKGKGTIEASARLTSPPKKKPCKNRFQECSQKGAPIEVMLKADGSVIIQLTSSKCYRIEDRTGLSCMKCPRIRPGRLGATHDGKSVFKKDLGKKGGIQGNFSKYKLSGKIQLHLSDSKNCGPIAKQAKITFSDLERKETSGSGQSAAPRINKLRSIFKKSKTE